LSTRTGRQLRIHDDHECAAVFGPHWDAMAAANPFATPFQSAWWYRVWSRLAAPAESCTPFVVTAGDGDRRAACAFGVYGGDRPVVRPLGWPWADYHDAVGARDEATAALVEAIVERVAAEHPLELAELRPGGLLERAGRRLGGTVTEGSTTVALDLRDAERLAEATGRKEYQLKRRRLQRLGALVTTQLRDPERIVRRLPAFIEMHRAQWAGRADAVGPFDGGAVDAVFLAAGAEGGARGEVVLTELTLDGEPLAMYFGFLRGRWYGGYRTTFKADARRFSPGHLMLHDMIHRFRTDGLVELDLMRGGYAYKMAYGTVVGSNVTIAFGGESCT
jgi:CelD/BcsL family acetyltransferase involved in cellulose biosynthesis